MQLRRLPIFLVAIYVLLSLVPQTDVIALRSVCQMTGLPMEAGPESVALARPVRRCCAKAPSIVAFSGLQKTLCRPSCCVIRAVSAAPAAARVVEFASTDTPAVLPAELNRACILTTTAKLRFAAADQRPLRGPPRRSGPSRAPPFFS